MATSRDPAGSKGGLAVARTCSIKSARQWNLPVILLPRITTQWTAEAMDFSLTLPEEQDKLIAAVARANKHTVVVLETGGAVLLPWLGQVSGLVEAWYPGSEGGKHAALFFT